MAVWVFSLALFIVLVASCWGAKVVALIPFFPLFLVTVSLYPVVLPSVRARPKPAARRLLKMPIDANKMPQFLVKALLPANRCLGQAMVLHTPASHRPLRRRCQGRLTGWTCHRVLP